MELAEYHRVFSHKTRSHIQAGYKNRGMDETKIPQDIVYYCLPTALMLTHVTDRPIIEWTPGFHPDVTPEIFATFMYRLARFDDPLMIKALEYEKIYEAVRILLSREKYWGVEFNDYVIIYRKHQVSGANVFELDADKFIFLMDVFARNNYATVLKNNIFVDYFGISSKYSVVNAYVDEFKQMCIESTKTC